jgi:Transposase DDE domain
MSRKQRAEQSSRIRKRVKKLKLVEKRRLFNELLALLFPSGSIFSKEQFHGNIKWDPEQLVIQALIWSWQDTQKVTDAFEKTTESCKKLGLKDICKTYTGFMDALSRYRKTIRDGLRNRLHDLAEQIGGVFFRNRKWVLMGFDGTRATAPRSKANEKAFCSPKYGSGKRATRNANKRKRENRNRRAQLVTQDEPQVWITMMWHMGLRLPWTWRLGPSNSSERGHVQEILAEEEFPANTLFCGDAGFTGFPLWNAILESGGHFLVRVGGNVKLLSEHVDFQQIQGGIVLCWPKDTMDSGGPPLRLRLVQVQVGKTMMWMLTSVLDERELSRKDIVQYYKMRWLIEVEFRGLKQTVDKHKLRCRNSDRLLAELDWSLLAMAFAELIALRYQIPRSAKEKSSYTPKHRSLANTLRVLRRYMRNPDEKMPLGSLDQSLKNALVQQYNNSTDKRARYRPRNANVKPLNDPIVTKLTQQQRRKLKEIALAAAA